MKQLYSYFRSSAAFRVRIALAYKGLDYDYKAINLLPAVADHKSADYLGINPQGRVPFFTDGDDLAISQSPAILEYLEEQYPEHSLMPSGAIARAEVRQLCSLIACDIHPLNNLAVLGYLKKEFGADQDGVNAWYAHWIQQGFAALEEMILRSGASAFMYGDSLTLADVYLVPQLWNALRFNVDLTAYPALVAIYKNLLTIPAVIKALPENQPDAPAG